MAKGDQDAGNIPMYDTSDTCEVLDVEWLNIPPNEGLMEVEVPN